MGTVEIGLLAGFFIAFGIHMYKRGEKSGYKKASFSLVNDFEQYKEKMWEMHAAGVKDCISTINKMSSNVKFKYDEELKRITHDNVEKK
jgi:hypothetical protein